MRVLIAEDDPVIGMGLAERLRDLGHEPIGPAGDGQGAIALAVADPPDLYLFDVDLPGLDGLAAAAWLADAGLRRPIVVVTGIDDADVIERSVANGAGAYLTKPVDTRELEAAVRLAAVRHAELQALEDDAAQARRELEERKIIERAKGLLMSALRLSEADAFHRLQLTARERNLRLVDVARRIVEQERLLTPQPSQSRRSP
jgi:AmiR/NasT family two-component response regulator